METSHLCSWSWLEMCFCWCFGYLIIAYMSRKTIDILANKLVGGGLAEPRYPKRYQYYLMSRSPSFECHTNHRFNDHGSKFDSESWFYVSRTVISPNPMEASKTLLTNSGSCDRLLNPGIRLKVLPIKKCLDESEASKGLLFEMTSSLPIHIQVSFSLQSKWNEIKARRSRDYQILRPLDQRWLSFSRSLLNANRPQSLSGGVVFASNRRVPWECRVRE